MNAVPIVIVDDDADDADLLVHALQDLNIRNPFKYFATAQEALSYLRSTSDDPLMIISDINMPCMTGFAFKKLINEDKVLHEKHIPFIFLSTSNDNYDIRQALNLSIQGFFQKPGTYRALLEIAKAINDYWQNNSMLHFDED